MLSLIMDANYWTLANAKRQGGRWQLQMSHSYLLNHAANQLSDLNALSNALKLSHHQGQQVCMGMAINVLRYACLDLPASIKSHELESYSCIKLAKLLNTTADDVAVDFLVMSDERLFVVGCLLAEIKKLKALCQLNQLKLQKVDLNLYSLVAALIALGYITEQQWHELQGIIIYKSDAIECIQLQQQTILAHKLIPWQPHSPLSLDAIHRHFPQLELADMAAWLCLTPALCDELSQQCCQQSLSDSQPSIYRLMAYGLLLRSGNDSS